MLCFDSASRAYTQAKNVIRQQHKSARRRPHPARRARSSPARRATVYKARRRLPARPRPRRPGTLRPTTAPGRYDSKRRRGPSQVPRRPSGAGRPPPPRPALLPPRPRRPPPPIFERGAGRRAHYPVARRTSRWPARATRSPRRAPQLRGSFLQPVWKSKFYGKFVLNYRVVLHAIDATPARWRGDAGSLLLDGASTAASSPRCTRLTA